MSRNSMLLFVASLTMASALVVDRIDRSKEADRGSALMRLRPDVAAKMLAKMENIWAAQAHAFIGCAANGADFNCKEAPKAFAKSCEKVTSKVISVSAVGSINEYMADICKHMKGWHLATCQSVSTSIASQMSANDYDNRQSAGDRAKKSCKGLWSHYVAEQKARASKEKALEKAQEQEDSKKEKAQEAAAPVAAVAAVAAVVPVAPVKEAQKMISQTLLNPSSSGIMIMPALRVQSKDTKAPVKGQAEPCATNVPIKGQPVKR